MHLVKNFIGFFVVVVVVQVIYKKLQHCHILL